MRYVGRITEWNDDRGFGFVAVEGISQRVFVHINAFDCAVTRPQTGAVISYHLLTDDNGRLNATGIRLVKSQTHRRPARRFPVRKAICVLFFAAMVTGVFAAKVPLPVALAYAFMSVVAVQLYGIDKSAAISKQWRIPEATLHFIGLTGGWPGALFAQAAFRHKTNKASFLSIFWLTVLLNCAGLTWFISQGTDLGLPLMGLNTSVGLPSSNHSPEEPGLPTITPLGQ